MAQNRESLSELSRRRTSWILSVLGLIVLMLFITVLCSMRNKKDKPVVQEDTISYTLESTIGDFDSNAHNPAFDIQGTQLVITPTEVSLPDVILGSQAEAALVLRAENGPLMFLGKALADSSENGFVLSGPCMEKTQLDKGEECLLKVSWAPIVVQTIQNTLTITWREDSTRVFDSERSQVQLRASSTDSKECVCCDIEKEKEPRVPRKVVGLDGTERELTDADHVVGEVVMDEDGNVIAIVEPERVALSLKNEYLGRVSDRRTVVDKDGTLIGRLLGDDTLVDTDFKVLGAAVPLVSVLDAQGTVIGKMLADDDGVRVVDADGKEIGTPRVDKTVVDKAGVQIGTLRDWGAALDLSGDYLGVILPTGAIIDSSKKVQGYIQQNGFVTSESGALIGGVVPKGIAVGTGCRSYGAVALNGQVKDAYGQVVGRVMLDGGVVDTNFNEIGRTVNQGLVVSMKGEVVGFVNSEGKAVNGRGALMGCVAPNGTVAANKTMIGGILQKGMVTGKTCGVIGSVYPDAKVMSPDVREVGRVRSDAYAIDPSNKVIGSVVPHGTVMAEGCRLVGTISLTGQILNEQNVSVGCINMQKQAIDRDGKEIGKITPTGPVLAADGSLIGRVRYDGRIIDKQGSIIDCVNPDGEGVSQDKGVVLDANGQLTPWTVLAGKCFNERNEEIGVVASNGWVSNKQGQMIGFMPPDGIVFSPTGSMLGHYNRLMGSVLDASGEIIGRLMPDGTVLNAAGTQILGAAITQNAMFVGLDGAPLGRLNYEGVVADDSGNSLGQVFPDGSLYGADRSLIGGAVSSGVVIAANGKQVGWANTNGDVLSKGTRIANLLPNGLAITPDNRVLGRVCPPISVLVAAQGVSGTIVPRAVSGDASSYQLAGYDKMGNYMGVMSAYGVLLGSDGRLNGSAVPVSMVVDLQNKFLGWVNFSGAVVDADEKEKGRLIQNGLVVNAEGSLVGKVLNKGPVVDETGRFVGHVGPDGFIYKAGEATGLFIEPGNFAFNSDFTKTVRLLPKGLAISSVDKMLGWTTFDGRIVNSDQFVGFVTLSNRVMDADNNLLAGFVPFGAPSVQEDEKMCGVVNEAGAVVSASGRVVGTVSSPDYAVQNNMITGRIRSGSLFVRHIVDSELTGVVNFDSLVYKPNTARQMGSIMMNDLMVDSSKKIVAGSVPYGFAYSTNLKALGAEDLMGNIWQSGKVVGTSSGVSFVSQGNGLFSGGIFAPELILDRNGIEIGRTNALTEVVDKSGKKIASRMAFDSALTPETIWAGGPLKSGAVIDDYARKIGVVTSDGTINNNGAFKGRILPDGSAAGVSERAVYNTMPYVGHLTTQGVPMGYSEKVLGRTTVLGDLIDASDKIIYQMLDDGTVLGKERPLEGIILTFRPAVSYHDVNLGVFDGDGKIALPTAAQDGTPQFARVATNGALVPESAASSDSIVAKLKEEGGLIPDSLIVNDSCTVIGQTAYTGEVVNGQGNTVARMQPTLYAVDPQGRELGRSVRYGPVTTMDTKGAFVGRSLSDSTAVNPAGVNIGCVRMDNILIDANGNELGRLRHRGPVFDGTTHKMEGRVDAMGRVVCMNGEICGTIGGRDKDIWYDLNGNERGVMFDREKRLLFNPDGTLAGAIGRDGWVVDANDNKLYRIDQATGQLYDKDGNLIGSLDGGAQVFLYDMKDNIVARLLGCELHKHPSGEKMGTVLANGEIRDDSNELILTTTADGKVYNPDNTQFGRFRGIGLDLRRCGLSAVNVGLSPEGGSRQIKWGSHTYNVEPGTGMITDKNGTVVGVWDPSNNRPYIWDQEEAEEPEPVKPPIKTRPDISPEIKAKLEELQTKRRTQMKEKMAAQGTLVLPGYNVEQMAQVGASNDWSSVGTEKKNISTWPVDMSRVLLADKAVPAVLVRSIDSRYPDVPVTAIVERHIYAEAGRNILIPAGSRLIGKATSSTGVFGADQAAKIDISWERLIRPDGAAFRFQAVSGDAQGRGGVASYLDLQLLKKFSLPFISTIGAGLVLKLTELNEGQTVSATSDNGSSTTSETPGHQTRKMFIDNFKEMWNELMEMSGEIPNIVYVPSGTRLTAFSKEDLWLRSDDDPAEKKSENVKPPLQADTFLPRNPSWTGNRSKEREEMESRKASESEELARNSKQGEAPVSEPVYMPDDLENRTVDPVSRHYVDPNRTNSYF